MKMINSKNSSILKFIKDNSPNEFQTKCLNYVARTFPEISSIYSISTTVKITWGKKEIGILEDGGISYKIHGSFFIFTDNYQEILNELRDRL